ncbi:MAG: NAD+ synthase [Myxococcota bacterium]
MRVALAQQNPTVGALEANTTRLLELAEQATRGGADLIVSSELALTGYPPLDLLGRSAFLSAAEAALARLTAELPAGIIAVVGTVLRRAPGTGGKPFANAAVVLERGQRLAVVEKALLPVYDVFDEARYFEPATPASIAPLNIRGKKVGITICEDLWNDAQLFPERPYAFDPVERLAEQGAELVLNLSASPWSLKKQAFRRRLVRHAAQRHRVLVAMANQIGGNDGLLFDGASIAYAAGGALIAEGRSFAEDLVFFDTERSPEIAEPKREPIADLVEALSLGIRDFFGKCGAKKAVLGLSGGIDSAVVASLAVRALGAENVTGLAMPSRYSSEGSVLDAQALAHNLGVRLVTIPIEPMFEAFVETLAPAFAGKAPDVTEENLQSRLRGVTVMAYSNKHGGMVLTTGNKSECAMGYATLYGDTAGALAPIADLYKHQVYAIARYLNQARPTVPLASIDKPPSAELRPGQKDEDSLPPYAVLDPILEGLLEDGLTVEATADQTGQPVALVREIARKVAQTEFKRRQYAPTLRVSERAWTGRVFPIAQRFSE